MAKYTVNFSFGNSGTFKGIKTARKAIIDSGFARWGNVNIFEGSKVVGYVFQPIGKSGYFAEDYHYRDSVKRKIYTLKKDGSLGKCVYNL